MITGKCKVDCKICATSMKCQIFQGTKVVNIVLPVATSFIVYVPLPTLFCYQSVLLSTNFLNNKNKI